MLEDNTLIDSASAKKHTIAQSLGSVLNFVKSNGLGMEAVESDHQS